MTPHTTDRTHSMSPLDMFGPLPSTSGSAPLLDPAQRFEHVLKGASSSATDNSNRELADPVSSGYADRPIDDSSARRPLATSTRKVAAKSSGVGAPTKDESDERLPEESDDPSVSSVAAGATTPLPQATEDPKESVDEDSVQPNLENNLLSAMEGATAQSVATGNLAAEDASGDADSGIEETTTPQSKGPTNPKVPSSDDLLSAREYEPTVHGNGPLSLAEPAATSAEESSTVDPIAAIDSQATLAELATNQDDDTSQNEGESNSESGKSAVDVPVAPAPTADSSGTSQTPEQDAAPPTAAVDVPDSTKDNAPSPATSSTPTASPPSTSRLPQHVLARTEAHRHNPAPVPLDSARFLSRVAKAFLAAQQRDGEVRLRLSPPELGSLRLQVSVQDGVMVARMETETEAARSSLVNNLPTLRERLAEQGIRIERFDIDLMQRPSTGTPDRPSDPQQQNEPQPLRTLRAQNSSPEISSPTSVTNNWNGNGRLNVII